LDRNLGARRKGGKAKMRKVALGEKEPRIEMVKPRCVGAATDSNRSKQRGGSSKKEKRGTAQIWGGKSTESQRYKTD